MRTRITRSGLIALLLAAFSVAAVSAAAGELRPLKNPAPASAFMLRDLDGKLVSLRDFEGKVVLLNFWATWCANCRKEMPAMERLYQSLRAEGFAIVAISVDQVSTEKVKAFAEELKLTFPVLHDRDSIISRLYNNPGVPVSYLVDREGRIVYRVVGEYDWFSPEARATVKALLQKDSNQSHNPSPLRGEGRVRGETPRYGMNFSPSPQPSPSRERELVGRFSQEQLRTSA